MLHTDCTFLLFYSFFLMNTEMTKNHVIKVYLFTFILETGLNSHANGSGVEDFFKVLSMYFRIRECGIPSAIEILGRVKKVKRENMDVLEV